MSNLYELKITDAETGTPVTAFTFSSSTTSDMTTWIIAPLDYNQMLGEIEQTYNAKQVEYEEKCNNALTKVIKMQISARSILNVLTDDSDEDYQLLREEIVRTLTDIDENIDDLINDALAKEGIIIDADTLNNKTDSDLVEDYVEKPKLRNMLKNTSITYSNGDFEFIIPECVDVDVISPLTDCNEIEEEENDTE